MLHTMKTFGLFIFISASFTFLSPSVYAQEMPQAAEREGVTYYLARYVKFKPGKANQGRKIVYEHYKPTDQAIGLQTITFDFMTGPWDHVAYFPLEEGPSALAWEVSPQNAEWVATFAEQEGGMDEVRKIWAQYSDLVLEEQEEIVMRREEEPGNN